MDSMRSLNSSLPASSTKRQKRSHLPSGVQQAFKAAAFSVTQLYKAAAAEEDAARAAGYQDAVAELLNFLDDENLGVGDGEGWSIRQWAHERISPDPTGSDSDIDEDPGSEPPTVPQADEAVVPSQDVHNTGEGDRSGAVPIQQSSPMTTTTTLPQRSARGSPDATRHSQAGVFQFTANQRSRDTDMLPDDTTLPTMQPPSSFRLNVRPSRTSRQRRHSRERSHAVQSLGRGAGLKRKTSANFDFIDFAGLGKDWNGHGHGHGGGGGSGPAKKGRWE